ncbi:hypothetical protein MPH47_04230 [Psychrobacillus psychrodurans]|uniref:hypothetical protein n=1 Tax=Psychrobacillus psychrodurans TaxID=126157 RepID=UPI001F4E0622|nr:hypothetical protein [Psychrobacillus psychrodurans]MCK1996453.1 hypothetical protein [Psychrobacillus psychrodurans]
MHLLSPKEKLNEIIEKSWEIFICQFTNRRLIVSKEAPFQHNFGNILRQVGDLYCFSRTEQFYVDLEVREENINGKTKYIDITCNLLKDGEIITKAAIELKFKKKSQGADDEARIDAYSDIHSLEGCIKSGYDLAYFFMITDNGAYTRKSKKLDSTAYIFSMCNDHVTTANLDLVPKLKTRKDIKVNFNQAYKFSWKNIDENYFLMLPVQSGF